MKKITLFALIVLLVSFANCSGSNGPDPKEAPSKAMLDALQKLDAHDYDAYIACTDITGEDDSTHMELYKQLLNQHQEYQDSTKGSVDNYDIVDVMFTNDSVCTVLYQIVFNDSTKEVSSQKMLRINGNWKIKIRN